MFHYDEQRIMINGREHWRYTIIDGNNNIICNSIKEKRNQETIEKVLIEELAGREVEYVVTDLDNKCERAIEGLRQTIAKHKRLPLSSIKIRHQLCIFHQLMNARKMLEDLYPEKTRKKFNTEEKNMDTENCKHF
ncbi:MAG: DDE-type integrase/transposase/recombinase [Candidatus Micrarchaeaceae archaeon]